MRACLSLCARTCVCMCLCVRVHVSMPLRALITSGVILNGLIITAAFQFHFMAPAVDFIDRRGPSNEIHRHLQPKETKVTLYYPCILQPFTHPLLLARQSASVLKVGVSHGWKIIV